MNKKPFGPDILCIQRQIQIPLERIINDLVE